MAKAQLSLQGIAPVPRAQLLACALAALERHIGAMSAGAERQAIAQGHYHCPKLCMLSSAVLCSSHGVSRLSSRVCGRWQVSCEGI